MATSPKGFLIELYEEYLEEASFLYEQRISLLQDPEITWKDVGSFEERLEAHIDGLVVGDKLALEVCKRAAAGDSGEVFAATCVFCRQDRQDLLLSTLDQLDPDDADKAGAVADALKFELPQAWTGDFLTLLATGDPKLAAILARTFGYRRLPCGPQLLTAMKRCAPAALPEMIWALGRIGHGPANEPLMDYLRNEKGPVRSAAALALARIGDSHVIEYCLDQAQFHDWPILLLGVAGGPQALAVLTDLTNTNRGADCVIALGLHGDPASVPLLLSRLAQPEAAASVSIALHALTGAGLTETVFIRDEVDEDELFESEAEQLKQGKTLNRGDGKPFGSTVTRLCQNLEIWNSWWQTNRDRFTPGVRYRNGAIFSPERLTDMLAAESTPHVLRRYCSEELVTRYGQDFGIETDMPAARQINFLSKAAAWSQSNRGRFEEGAWYFAGRPAVAQSATIRRPGTFEPGDFHE